MKFPFSLSWFLLVVASPPTVFAMVATTKKNTKHAKKNKTSDGTSNDGTSDGFFPIIEPPVDNVALDLTCDPSQTEGLGFGNGCEDNDCAHPVWADGCEACMCFNPGNAAWCDGYRGDFYDKYFEEHGDNPWGDPNVRNRKCNTIFRPSGSLCLVNWQCAAGLKCVDSYKLKCQRV